MMGNGKELIKRTIREKIIEDCNNEKCDTCIIDECYKRMIKVKRVDLEEIYKLLKRLEEDFEFRIPEGEREYYHETMQIIFQFFEKYLSEEK